MFPKSQNFTFLKIFFFNIGCKPDWQCKIKGQRDGLHRATEGLGLDVEEPSSAGNSLKLLEPPFFHSCLHPHPFSTQQLVLFQNCKRDPATPLLQAPQWLSNTQDKFYAPFLDLKMPCDPAQWLTLQTHLRTFSSSLTLLPLVSGIICFPQTYLTFSPSGLCTCCFFHLKIYPHPPFFTLLASSFDINLNVTLPERSSLPTLSKAYLPLFSLSVPCSFSSQHFSGWDYIMYCLSLRL